MLLLEHASVRRLRFDVQQHKAMACESREKSRFGNGAKTE